MGRVTLFIIVIILLIGGGIYFLRQSPKPITPAISPTPTITATNTPAENSFCNPSDLVGNIVFNGAAGSIYGNLTLKNVSNKTCTIDGSNFVTASFSAQNISVVQQGQAGPDTIALTPNQTAYSQIRYQNGPQCSSPIKTTPVIFSYQISSLGTVDFLGQNGSKSQNITTCTKLSESTTVWVWNVSKSPITPQ
ncbi:MAG TPA: DUF4232 domain-containing protein [Patescibacteria group bacterium]|nr:DUF4232 domain-containing protein [Patescibacteria group bacterium]